MISVIFRPGPQSSQSIRVTERDRDRQRDRQKDRETQREKRDNILISVSITLFYFSLRPLLRCSSSQIPTISYKSISYIHGCCFVLFCFEPGRHLGIWKKRASLGVLRNNGTKTYQSAQGSMLGNMPYKRRGSPFPPIHPWSLEPAAGDDVQNRA